MTKLLSLTLTCVVASLLLAGCDEEEADLCAEVDCGDHGTCEAASGACQCDSGYSGSVCDQLEVDCGDHGTSNAAQGCDCDAGWSGALCDECAEGYLSDGAACVEAECLEDAGCDDQDPCNGQETCDGDHLCQPGTPVDCGDHGACNPDDLSCSCDEGYEWVEAQGDCLREVLADLDDLTLEAESFWDGADLAGSFTSGAVSFLNAYNEEWASWDGFAYSSMTDTETPGFANQYSAITGEGARGSAIYAVAYVSDFSPLGPPALVFDEPTALAGLRVTNTTYAYLTLRDGDEYAKQFGGETGEDPDWFLLTIHGRDGEDAEVGTVEVYLADFRAESASEDFIVDSWIWVDLSGLGEVASLQFTLTSSDNGDYGMNTPAYFAIDDILRYGR